MNRPSGSRVSPSSWAKIAPFALIALISFLFGVGLLSITIWKAEKLVALGLTGNLFYIILLPIGLSSAFCLFGILRSYATYRGKALGGTLELSGPVVVFALVVIGGFALVPSVAPFDLTVYVHGEKGMTDMVLKNSGYVLVDIGTHRYREAIGDKGESHIPGIPANFRGQEVVAAVESADFESIGGSTKLRLNSQKVYLPVRRKAGRISGRVEDPSGNAIAGAEISLVGQRTLTDQSGHFELTIPGSKVRPELDLYASAPGYSSEHYIVVPNANDMSITLTKAH